MSTLRRRVLALDRQVRWLESDGKLLWCFKQLKFFDMKQRVIDNRPDIAVEWGLIPAPPEPKPPPSPPRPPPVPKPEPRPDPPVMVQPPAPPTWQPYDPPEHMQIRPVRWRLRDATDYLE